MSIKILGQEFEYPSTWQGTLAIIAIVTAASYTIVEVVKQDPALPRKILASMQQQQDYNQAAKNTIDEQTDIVSEMKKHISDQAAAITELKGALEKVSQGKTPIDLSQTNFGNFDWKKVNSPPIDNRLKQLDLLKGRLDDNFKRQQEALKTAKEAIEK